MEKEKEREKKRKEKKKKEVLWTKLQICANLFPGEGSGGEIYPQVMPPGI